MNETEAAVTTENCLSARAPPPGILETLYLLSLEKLGLPLTLFVLYPWRKGSLYIDRDENSSVNARRDLF